MEDFYKQFKENASAFYEALKHEYTAKIEKAREGFKGKAHYEYWQKIVRDDHQKVQQELGTYSRFFYEIKDEWENDKDKEFIPLFNQKLNAVNDVDKTLLVQNLSQLEAINKIIKYMQDEGEKYPRAVEEFINPHSHIKWLGGELEFVLWIYGFHEARKLDNEEKEITTLVKQVAAAFNFPLSEYWQSTLSDCVNNRNADYEPKIFKEGAEGYAAYRDRQIEINRKKKLK